MYQTIKIENRKRVILKKEMRLLKSNANQDETDENLINAEPVEDVLTAKKLD